MRGRSVLLLFMCTIVTCTIAHAEPDLTPLFAARAGAHRTNLVLEFTYEGEPHGNGFAGELEAGACFRRQWCVTAFGDYASFRTRLGLEWEEGRLSWFDSSFRNIYLGARVTWRPVPRLFLSGGIGKAYIKEQQDGEGDQFGVYYWQSPMLEARLGAELVRHEHVTVQLTIGVAGDRFEDIRWPGRVGLYVPLLIGLAWD